MTISALSIDVDASISTTGGTATGVVSKGNTLNSHKVLLDDGSAFALQPLVQFDVKDPSPSANAPGGFTQARKKVHVQLPWTLSNGERTIDTVNIEINCDPECSDARMAMIRSFAAQLIAKAALDGFFNDNSVA